MRPCLEFKGVRKGYGSGARRTEVLADLNLSVAPGEFVAILGYSGSGKTTLMSMLAGLSFPDEGEVLHAGVPVTGPDPRRGLVFQNYSLLPWLTVEGNVALAVDRLYAHESKKERRDRVLDAVELVHLTPALHKRPGELSGGMRQRVSVARTLATNPEVLLLDEPFSALDALTRSVLQDEVLEIRDKLKQTIVMITNDVDEGLYLADRIIPLSMGPGATFGPESTVSMKRPRHRIALNHDEACKATRLRVIDYLLGQRRASRPGIEAGPARTLPQLKPVDLTASSNATLATRFFGRLPADAST